jgi:hypothetical protein
MSVERASRFVVAWARGPRDEALAEEIVTVTRDRTGRSAAITYVTDGWLRFVLSKPAVRVTVGG